VSQLVDLKILSEDEVRSSGWPAVIENHKIAVWSIRTVQDVVKEIRDMVPRSVPRKLVIFFARSILDAK
jgi:hypothetical protein